MNPYIEYEIRGLTGIRINNGNSFSIENDPWMDSVEIMLNDSGISGIRILFKHDVIIDNNIIELSENKIKQFIINIVCNLDVIIDKFDYVIVLPIYNPNEIKDKANKLQLISRMSFRDSLTLISGYDISRFCNMFCKSNVCENWDEQITVLINIMKIDNIVVRYLVQYDFLMKIVPQNGGGQKNVTNFIKEKYNPTLNFNMIGFKPTRRENANFDEDEITYYRNILAHNGVVSIDMKELEDKINLFSRVMNKVIYFAMNYIDKNK